MPNQPKQEMVEIELSIRELRMELKALHLETVSAVRETKKSDAKSEASPLLIAIATGIITLIAGLTTGIFAIVSSANQAKEALKLELRKELDNHQLESERQSQDQKLENIKLRSSLILKLTEQVDPNKRKESLLFYSNLGFLGDDIGDKIEKIKPENIPQAPTGGSSQPFGGSYSRVDGTFVIHCGFSIDPAGAPNAYSPSGSGLIGLDLLANAGHPGNWWGVVVDDAGTPMIQGANDPAPGYYISTTDLQDTSKPLADPRRYVNSGTIPYITLPSLIMNTKGGPQLGDLVVVYSKTTTKFAYAIIADRGPAFGEGSIALARNLSLPLSIRENGTSTGITMVVFPNSNRKWPLSAEEINALGDVQLRKWGNEDRVRSFAE